MRGYRKKHRGDNDLIYSHKCIDESLSYPIDLSKYCLVGSFKLHFNPIFSVETIVSDIDSEFISSSTNTKRKSQNNIETESSFIIKIDKCYKQILLLAEHCGSRIISEDITQGASISTVHNIHIGLTGRHIICSYTNENETIKMNIYLQYSEPTNERFYTLDLLTWCLEEGNLPSWINYYTQLNPVTASDNEGIGRDFANDLLNDIATNRSDVDYTDADLNKTEKKLIQLGLVTELRRYQLRGVLWLRDHLEHSISLSPPAGTHELGALHGWVPLTGEEPSAWFSLVTGELIQKSSSSSVQPYETVRGAILGDFMGLGKSVQILCLLLLHKSAKKSPLILPSAPIRGEMTRKSSSLMARPCSCGHRELHHSAKLIQCPGCLKTRHASCVDQSTDHRLCFTCVCNMLESNPLPCSAALLILPSGLISQWIAEIRKHMPSALSFFVYNGVKKTMSTVPSDVSASLSVDPRSLGSHDVVITSLSVLRDELHYFSQIEKKTFRKQQVYDRLISPLSCLKWKMLIVDETQQIEDESQASQVAMRLEAYHRIVLSGTPIAHFAVDDIQYLFKFLRVSNFVDMRIWKALISNPFRSDYDSAYKRLLALLKPLMLRRRKSDVEDELMCTSQTYDIQSLTLSSFEQMEYDAHENPLINDVRSCSTGIESAAHQRILRDVEILRKRCCHPHAFTRNGLKLSFDEVMIARAEKLALEIEDEQRKLLYNLMGLAGCCLLQANILESEGKLDESLHYILLTCNTYWASLNKLTMMREICDILAIGTVSSDDDLLATAFKSVRADDIRLSWSTEKINLEELHEGRSLTLDNFAVWESPFLISSSHFDKTVNSRNHIDLFGDSSTGLGAKIDLTNSKRICEVHVSHGLDTDDYLNAVQAGNITVLVFASEVNINGGANLTKGIHIDLPSPLINVSDESPIIRDKLKFEVGGNGFRSKSLSIRANSFHGNCLLLIRKDDDRIWHLVAPIHALKGIEQDLSLPLKLVTNISVKLRGCEYDVDPFQELHIRENLSSVLLTLNSRGVIRFAPEKFENLKFRDFFLAQVDVALNANHEFERDSDEVAKIQEFSTEDSAVPIADAELNCVGTKVDDYSCISIAEDQMSYTRSIKEEYVQRAISRQIICTSDLKRSIGKCESIANSIKEQFGNFEWWSELLEIIVRNNGKNTDFERLSNTLMTDIRAAVGRGQLAYTALNKITIKDMDKIISRKMNEILTNQDLIRSAFLELSTNPTEGEIRETSNCRKCCESHGKIGPICSHCMLEIRVVEYSSLLFTYKRKVLRLKQVREDKPIYGDEGLFAVEHNNEFEVDGEVIMLSRELRKFISSSVHQPLLHVIGDSSLQQIRAAARVFDELLTAIQHELILLRAMWASHQNLLFAFDDLDQAVTTVKLLDPEQSFGYRNGFLHRTEIPEQALTNYFLALQSFNDIKMKTSKMRFIRYEESWRRSVNVSGAEANKECVICQMSLIEEIRVLPCFHSFHKSCILKWLNTKHSCPLCQTFTLVKDLTEVETTEAQTTVLRKGTQPSIKIIGDFGTKINVIIGDVLRLVNTTEEKAIIFSQWPEILQLLGSALKQNNITFTSCFSSKDLSSTLRSSHIAPLDLFKYDSKFRVLLLPLNLGSNGLSIVEATHVFLVEPLLNEAIESQAIARVARIGQFLPTFVHKYVLKNTIEEKIQLSQSLQRGGIDSFGIKHKIKSPVKSSRISDCVVTSMDAIKKLFDQKEISTVLHNEY